MEEKNIRKLIRQLIKEEFDVASAIEGSTEDGYDEIKAFLKPKYDFDFEELYNNNFEIWETEKLGDISVSLEKGNVWTITCRTDEDHFGEHSTYDFDEHGLAFCFMAAIKDLISDYEETFVNQP